MGRFSGTTCERSSYDFCPRCFPVDLVGNSPFSTAPTPVSGTNDLSLDYVRCLFM